jgi:hypothetical protein
MYGKEYQAWLTLGGDINFLTIIDDVCDLIKQSSLYNEFPETMSAEEKRTILERTALYIISQDYAKLIHVTHRTKIALDNDQVEKAQTILEHLFTE